MPPHVPMFLCDTRTTIYTSLLRGECGGEGINVWRPLNRCLLVTNHSESVVPSEVSSTEFVLLDSIN